MELQLLGFLIFAQLTVQRVFGKTEKSPSLSGLVVRVLYHTSPLSPVLQIFVSAALDHSAKDLLLLLCHRLKLNTRT